MIDGNLKKQFLEELTKCGNIYRSCLRVGIHRSTFYRWRSEDENFRRKAEKAERIGRTNNTDIGEYMLMVNVKKGNMWAIKYLLSHNSPIYRKPMSPIIQVFENAFPGEGFNRFQAAMALKKKFEELGAIPLRPGGSEITDTELEKYEKFIEEWNDRFKDKTPNGWDAIFPETKEEEKDPTDELGLDYNDFNDFDNKKS